MVKKGDFTLELINVETDEAFNEHTAPDGQTYFEVEPDAEYFIRVTKCIEEVVVVKIFVDGKYLGYRGFMKQQSDTYGLWTCQNLTSSNRALKFCKANNVRRSVQATKGNDSSSFVYGGTVEARFFEAISNGFRERKDSGMSWKPKEIDSGQMLRKRVKTNAGSSVVHEKFKDKFETYSEGRNLSVIKVNYTTAVGLIHNNVLKKPPLWDWHRMQYAKPADEDIQQPIILPTKITTKIVIDDGSTIAQKEREFFDLTVLPDSDSKEESKKKHFEKDKEEINLDSTNDISADERNKLLADIADLGEEDQKKMGFII